MTVVIAWIEVERDVDEADARAKYLGEAQRVSRKIGQLPDKTRLAGGWIYGLQAWAAARRIALEFGADALDISVPLSRDQLHRMHRASLRCGGRAFAARRNRRPSATAKHIFETMCKSSRAVLALEIADATQQSTLSTRHVTYI
ncbi:hypothetical protein PQQ65_03470 [Paraburkholderia strydomiana]|uniref:hypothetical protein n=1 Tax=Paraburkholderia strydomiana TaxID=1245417 RepID=UPI0038BB73A3